MNQEWQKILVKVSTSVREALEVINRESYRMAFVVDEGGHLIGSVTDGDIRRALLKGLELSSPVAMAMNRNPKSATATTTKEKILDMMNRQHIHCVPILKNKKIVDLITRASIAKFRRDNPVFLMAGGFGKRLRPLTADCPKPLLKIGDTPILEIILERFIHAGFYRFTISTHYLAEMFKDHFGDGSRWGVEIDYIQETTPLGTAGALGLVERSKINSSMIVMNGDILTGVNFSQLLEFHQFNQSLATVCVSDYEYEIPFGVINASGDRITSIEEKPKKSVNINSGIYVFEPEVLNRIKRGEYLDMPTLIQKLIGRKMAVSAFPISGYWLDIGRKEDFDKAQQEQGAALKLVTAGR